MQALSPIIVIVLGAILRLLPHPPNFAPIAAMALFGGVYLNKRYALIVPMLAMAVSDVFLGFHSTIFFVYGSFLLIGLIGIWLKKHKNFQTVLGGAIASSVLFFFVTNLGVWLVGNIYPRTFIGLTECFTYALPFFRNTVFGDLFYVGIFFGGYELVTAYLKNFRIKHAQKA